MIAVAVVALAGLDLVFVRFSETPTAALTFAVLAFLILKTAPGQLVFTSIGFLFTDVLNAVDAGSKFVFGDNFGDFFFAFKVLPTIIFFSSVMAVLYHLRIIQKIVMGCAIVMQWTLRRRRRPPSRREVGCPTRGRRAPVAGSGRAGGRR